MRFMMWVGSTGGISRLRRKGKWLTRIRSVCSQQFGNNAIVHRKSPNEYFKYLFGLSLAKYLE